MYLLFTRVGSGKLEVAKHPALKSINRINNHRNARLTFARRLEMVQDLTARRVSIVEAAAQHGVTLPNARKWLGRYLPQCEQGLTDASSCPHHSPRTIEPARALLSLELRHRRMLHAQIARSVGVSASAVGRVLARAGLSKLSDLRPREPIQRYEHAQPDDLLYIDTKRLGRIERPSRRVTGNRRDSVDGAGWEFLFVAADDHARIAFTAMHPNDGKDSADHFLRRAVAYYALLGATIKRLLTDNGSSVRSALFRQACGELGIVHKFARAYRPQTNGNAERFVQSAMREYAYGQTYHSSLQRADALEQLQLAPASRRHRGQRPNEPTSRVRK